MPERTRVLIFIDWYLPGYKAGGPIRSVASIVHELKNEIDFSIITGDRDLGDDVSYPAIQKEKWTTAPDGTRVFYASPQMGNETLNKIISEEQFSIVYFNSIFSKPFTLTPLKLIRKSGKKCKIIVAPRGMLGAGALRIKATKKKLFFLYAKMIGLFKDVTWHASSEQEAVEIRTVFGNNSKILVAMNLSSREENGWQQKTKNRGEANFVFLSRISKKKNLLFALQLLREIPADKKVRFDIIGPKEDELYWKECQAAIDALPKHVQVNVLGALPPGEISKKLKEYHFLLLPTEHENFGHVISEALYQSCPVLISDQTPWRNLEMKKCGWDILLHDKQKWLEKLNEAIEMDQPTFLQWSENAFQLSASMAKDAVMIEAVRKLFVE